MLSAVPVPDSEVLGWELAVEVTCGPLFSAEQDVVAASTEPASTTAATRIGMRRRFRMPFMSQPSCGDPATRTGLG